jgi:hypothetical protein
MHAAEVVPHEIDRDGRRGVLDLLAEGVGSAARTGAIDIRIVRFWAPPLWALHEIDHELAFGVGAGADSGSNAVRGISARFPIRIAGNVPRWTASCARPAETAVTAAYVRARREPWLTPPSSPD